MLCKYFTPKFINYLRTIKDVNEQSNSLDRLIRSADSLMQLVHQEPNEGMYFWYIYIYLVYIYILWYIYIGMYFLHFHNSTQLA